MIITTCTKCKGEYLDKESKCIEEHQEFLVLGEGWQVHPVTRCRGCRTADTTELGLLRKENHDLRATLCDLVAETENFESINRTLEHAREVLR